MIPWHRLIGLTLTDFFIDTSYTVELETDLSVKLQLLDILIIRKKEGKEPEYLPDGLENLGPHNLLTYKSHQETLDGWTIDELIGHYANYRKKVSPDFNNLLPEKDFRLFAVSTRFPEKLADQIEFKETGPGVYDIKWGHKNIKMIVLSRIAETEKNAPWLMFSAVPEKVKYGAEQYQWKTPVSSIINRLFKKYKIEGVAMPYTIEDYLKETREEAFKNLTEEDIDRILKGLKPEDRLRGLKPEDRLKGLTPEEVFKRFKAEDRLKGLTPEEIEEYLKKIRPTIRRDS